MHIRCKDSRQKSNKNKNVVKFYSQLSFKILNNDTSLIFSKVIIMTLKKSGKA